jgi:OOP family OmpA-OmpF porin
MRAPAAVAIAALVAAPLQPLVAQNAGVLEIGGFGRFSQFDRSLQLDNVFGGGAYLSLFAARSFALEVAGAYVPATGPAGADSVLFPLYARLMLGTSVGDEVALLVGGGYVHTFHGTSGRVSDAGVNGLLGVRFGLSRTLTFRLAAIADYVPSPALPAVPHYWNFALDAGVSAWFGRSRPRDGDRDGVADSGDACRDTRAGAAVDARGCAVPGDGDNDGVIDALDRCAQTGVGERVDPHGCVLAGDIDLDGVIDGSDQCLNTPRGSRVDPTGCPLDADRDGVSDAADECPRTPAGRSVNAIGCPGVFPDTQRVLVLDGVAFEAGTATLTTSARRVLEQVAVHLQADPMTRVEVAGHTDERGNEAGNLSLSWSQAEAVRRYLIERGVPTKQITARGFGASQPIDASGTPAGRTRNRRIELRRLG